MHESCSCFASKKILKRSFEIDSKKFCFQSCARLNDFLNYVSPKHALKLRLVKRINSVDLLP